MGLWNLSVYSFALELQEYYSWQVIAVYFTPNVSEIHAQNYTYMFQITLLSYVFLSWL